MADDPPTIRARARSAQQYGAVLRSRSTEERATWIEGAARALCEGSDLAGKALRTLPAVTGLSPPMVAWGLRTTLGTATRDALRALANNALATDAGRSEPISLVSIVLAGNVFTAAFRAIVVPLLLGVPVLVKAASSLDRATDTKSYERDGFAALLQDALRLRDSELGRALEIVEFQGGDLRREAALLELAEAASVYGSDAAVSAIEARAGKHLPVVAHGHGVSAAYCSVASQSAETIEQTVSNLATDLCAYDQRGCLSPQVIYVEESAEVRAERFTEFAAHALSKTQLSLPRGPLPASVAAAQTQWRGLAEVEGTLLRGAAYALAIQRGGSFRWSPGYRNATVVPVLGLAEALESMGRFAEHLKCVGTDPAALDAVALELEGRRDWAAYATALGTMQTPSIDAPADGRAVWEGLLKPR